LSKGGKIEKSKFLIFFPQNVKIKRKNDERLFNISPSFRMKLAVALTTVADPGIE